MTGQQRVAASDNQNLITISDDCGQLGASAPSFPATSVEGIADRTGSS